MNTVTVAPYGGWTISGMIETEYAGWTVIARPVPFGSDDPARPLAAVRLKGWEGRTIALDAADLTGSVKAEGARQWRSIPNEFLISAFAI
jgi:hypothetical protein